MNHKSIFPLIKMEEVFDEIIRTHTIPSAYFFSTSIFQLIINMGDELLEKFSSENHNHMYPEWMEVDEKN